MAYIASTFTFGTKQQGAFSGIFAWINEDWSKAKRIFLPPSCSGIEGRPSHDVYVNRTYIVGGFTQNMLIDEMFRACVQGISPPHPPVVSAGAGAVAQIGYLRFYDEITGERSSLSPGTEFTGNTTRSWSTLPSSVPAEVINIEGDATIANGYVQGVEGVTNFQDLRPGDRIALVSGQTRWAQVRSIQSPVFMTIDDTTMAGTSQLLVKPFSRVSHVELWVSVGGALPRFILRVRIGTTSITESVATLALGEAFVDSYEPMPRGSYNVIYNSRQIVAGVPGQLDRVFVSQIGFPERYGGLNFQTKYGEPTVGLIRTRDYVIVLCPDSSYRLQGYTEDDFVMQGLEPKMGGIGHAVNAVCGGRVFIPSREQIQVFDGSFHDAMPQRSREWASKLKAYADAFQMGRGIVDPTGQTYRFLPFALRQPSSGGELVIGSPGEGVAELCPGHLVVADPKVITDEKIYMGQSYSPSYGPMMFYFSDRQDPPLQAFPYDDPIDYGPNSDSIDNVIYSEQDGIGLVGGFYNDYSVQPTVPWTTLKRFKRGSPPEMLAKMDALIGGVTLTELTNILRYEGVLYALSAQAGAYRIVDVPDQATGLPMTFIQEPPIPPQDHKPNGMLLEYNGDLWALGGWGGGGPAIACYKRAGTWNLFIADLFPDPPGWQALSYIHDAVVFKGAIYVLGWNGGGPIWSGGLFRITPDGLQDYTFGQVSSRYGQALCVFRDKLYLLRTPSPVEPDFTQYKVIVSSWDGVDPIQANEIPWVDEKVLSDQFGHLIFDGFNYNFPPYHLFFGGFHDTLRLCIATPTGWACPVNWYSAPEGGENIGGTWISHEAWNDATYGALPWHHPNQRAGAF